MPDVFNQVPAPSHLLAPLKRGFQLALRSPFTSLPPAAIPASAALFEVSLKLLLFVNGLAEFSIYGRGCQEGIIFGLFYRFSVSFQIRRRYSISEIDAELIECLSPIPWNTGPFLGYIDHSQVEGLSEEEFKEYRRSLRSKTGFAFKERTIPAETKQVKVFD